MTKERESLFSDLAAEAELAAIAFPYLARMLRAFADGFCRADKLAQDRDLYKRQLEAVDRMLPPWESERVSHASAVGRVQTIKNLLEDRGSWEMASRV